MTTLRRFLRLTLHGATLVFCAFWLVATSSEGVPARDCFTGITNPTQLTVSLGAIVQQADGGTDAAVNQSCLGIDGLAAGGTVTLSLKQGPRPQSAAGCYQYQTTAVEGVTDMTVSTTDSSFESPFALTVATGSYASSSPTSAECRGTWTLVLAPDPAPPSGSLVSPLNAGASQQWTITRTIDLDQAQFCGGLFTQAGAVTCEDTFTVAGITEQAP